MKRRPLICGNWKMNTRLDQGLELARALGHGSIPSEVEVAIAPPFTHLHPLGKVLEGKEIKLSAQTMSHEDFGAFTGEVAAEMLLDLGVEYVILGHSERRALGEGDEVISKKVKKAFASGLKPIVCVGEDQRIKDAGKTQDFVLTQVERAIEGLSEEELSSLVIAYEPIWAIGTGKTASAQDAQDMAQSIRGKVEKIYPQASLSLRILYGGSAKPDNAASILKMEDVDGLLVGGASLKSEDFLKMVEIGAQDD